MLYTMKEMYNYREMLKNLVKRDLRTRYKESFLGFLWTFVNPLLQLIVYSLIFSTVLRMNVDKYPMFLFVALLPWLFFANTTQSGATLIISNGSLVKKVYFPREILPISITLSGLINLALSLIIAVLALVVFKIPLTISLLMLPLVMLIQFIFILGVTFIVSAINVYLRDVEHLWTIFLMAWFYLTPIVYPMEIIPTQYLKYFFLNPVTLMIIMYRDIMYLGQMPDSIILVTSFILSCFVLWFGYLLFMKLSKGFAEEI